MSVHEIPAPTILKDQFMLYFRMTNRSDRTVQKWTDNLRRFITWCDDRGITCVTEVTPESWPPTAAICSTASTPARANH